MLRQMISSRTKRARTLLHVGAALLHPQTILPRLGIRLTRGAGRRLIRKFLAGVAELLTPQGGGGGLVPALVPVRIRNRRRR